MAGWLASPGASHVGRPHLRLSFLTPSLASCRARTSRTSTWSRRSPTCRLPPTRWPTSPVGRPGCCNPRSGTCPPWSTGVPLPAPCGPDVSSPAVHRSGLWSRLAVQHFKVHMIWARQKRPGSAALQAGVQGPACSSVLAPCRVYLVGGASAQPGDEVCIYTPAWVGDEGGISMQNVTLPQGHFWSDVITPPSGAGL